MEIAMNIRMNRSIRRAPLALAVLVASACSADSPEKLAQRLQKSVTAKDVEAFAAEFDHFGALTGMEQFAALNLVKQCQEVACSFTAGPLTAEMKEKLSKGDPEVEATATPEGAIVFSAKSADGTRSLSGELPYAKVDGVYKVAGSRPTTTHLAKIKAITAQAATEEKLAKGVGGDPEWKSKATPLPADGGEPGKVFLDEVKAYGAALQAQDVDAAAKASAWGERVFGATDAGKPVPIEARKLALRVQSPRILVSARVLGGYLIGDKAVLIVEATNGAGNKLKGPVIMAKSFGDGSWYTADRFGLVEIPKGL
jgi:hypothetical protein